MDIYFQHIGNQNSDTVIVFLHEGLGSVQQWRDFPERLCLSINMAGFIYDRSGYGKSPGDLTNRESNYLHLAAEELETVIQNQLTHYNKIILFGHSDGGSIALIHAAKYPQKVIAIISEAAHVIVEKETLAGVEEAIAPFKAGKLDGLKKFHGDRYQEVFWAWNNIWLSPAFKHWSILNELSAITCPQLIIQGKDDQYGTLEQVALIEQTTTGTTQTFTPTNCGHVPHKDLPTEIINQSINFLNAL